MNVSYDINKGLEKKRTRQFTQLIVVTVVVLFGISMMTKGCNEHKSDVPISKRDTLVVIVKVKHYRIR